MEEFVKSLARPRKVIILVQAGKPVDATIDNLLKFLEPGDIIVGEPGSLRQPCRAIIPLTRVVPASAPAPRSLSVPAPPAAAKFSYNARVFPAAPLALPRTAASPALAPSSPQTAGTSGTRTRSGA